jgi:hypothetical protein
MKHARVPVDGDAVRKSLCSSKTETRVPRSLRVHSVGGEGAECEKKRCPHEQHRSSRRFPLASVIVFHCNPDTLTRARDGAESL